MDDFLAVKDPLSRPGDDQKRGGAEVFLVTTDLSDLRPTKSPPELGKGLAADDSRPQGYKSNLAGLSGVILKTPCTANLSFTEKLNLQRLVGMGGT